MVGVGRDLCGSSSPAPLPKQGHVQQAAEDLVQAGLEYLQRRRLHNLPEQPVPVFHQNCLCCCLNPSSLLSITSVGLKKIQSSLYLLFRWASWPCVFLDCCENCRPILSRVQSWGPSLLPCQESTWRPCDPAVIITEGAKQKFREIPRRSGECGCAGVKPRSAAACSGRVFFLGLFGTAMHKCFARTSGSEIVLYCFVSLQVPHLQTALYWYSFWAVKVTYLPYFWLVNEMFAVSW